MQKYFFTENRPLMDVHFYRVSSYIITLLLFSVLVGCGKKPWNDPYPQAALGAPIGYTSFGESPKTLDPAKSYSSNEYVFLGQIVEPPLQYHYLDRPYHLVPLTATSVPKPLLFDRDKHRLSDDASSVQVAYSVYRIQIKPGIYFQNHPAFAQDKEKKYFYHHLSLEEIEKVNSIDDFVEEGTRELTAADYVYQIKRLADPELHSPIFGLMSRYIVGLDEYAKRLQVLDERLHRQEDSGIYLDLRKYPLPGVRVIDRYTYEIVIKGLYPQFIYWLAMPFFAPMPWEVDKFYSQTDFADKNINLDWHPVGTGPYKLSINDPNRQMVMEKNENFHGESYPTEGSDEDRRIGLLLDAGKPLPFMDKFIFTLEKESIPRWSKFLQGYYDYSDIAATHFDQAVHIDERGKPHLTADMKKLGLRLITQVAPSSFYLGFNMLDPVVGGQGDRARYLRQALSIAIHYEEFVSIFANGRGFVAQSPLPPGIFGYKPGKAGINAYTHRWENGKIERRSMGDAKALMKKAGYPEGRDVKTGEPLVLYYDVMTSGGPDEKAQLAWMVKQFKQLGIQLQVRATHYNRFQEKMRTGHVQIFTWGWHADYPDPENFLFLLYGPNGKVKYDGENAANYSSDQFDRLFEAMRSMPNSPERQVIIDQMIDRVQYDAPWVFGYHPKDFTLSHQWNRINKPSSLGFNTLKYHRIDASLRERLRHRWNRPHLKSLWVIGLLISLGAMIMVRYYRRREYQPIVRR